MEKKRTRDIRFWVLVWGLGLVGQLCWNIENQWFNTFVYAKIAKPVNERGLTLPYLRYV